MALDHFVWWNSPDEFHFGDDFNPSFRPTVEQAGWIVEDYFGGLADISMHEDGYLVVRLPGVGRNAVARAFDRKVPPDNPHRWIEVYLPDEECMNVLTRPFQDNLTNDLAAGLAMLIALEFFAIYDDGVIKRDFAKEWFEEEAERERKRAERTAALDELVADGQAMGFYE